ncbi:unnamed protein product [Meloidogyne enterolobii]|uniref:Uncharacterized protein n=1 Tax=Meloidogyne enterolobii TaxID=390850 RepID=A0ACB1AKD6_MELEN
MLAPIVTKDMKLFPSQPLPARIKNVRSRAQSLQDFANGNAIHVTSSSAVSSNTHLVITANAARARNSQSIGSLPTNSVLATSFQNAQTNNAVMVIPSAKTPPKYSTSSASLRKPLDAIVEGVELSAQTSSVAQDSSSKDQKTTKIQNKKIKSSDIQSPSKSETTKTIKTSKPFTHRSSHDDVLSSSNKTNTKNEEKKSKRTQSVERERKKKEGKSGNSSSITGCFAMWLNSKFRKNGGGNNDGNSNTSTKTTPEPLIDGGGESTSR